MNYYEEIKNKIIDDEVYAKVKDYSKERHRVITYYDIGRLLHEAGKHYGNNIIGEYSKKLTVEVNKKYSRSTLFRIKQFYETFKNEKVAPVVRQLTWSHCLILLPLKDIDKIIYYALQIQNRNLSKRQLQDIVKLNEYERLSVETRNKIISNDEVSITNLIPNTIIIKNNNKEIYSEKILHKLIVDNIESFMESLGNNYCFIKSEYKIKDDNKFNYIDLLLFNYEFNCFVVVELKVCELKKEHIGQILIYMNYIDKNIKRVNHDKTIGIVICKKNNEYVIEYCSDKRIISREYKIM